MDRRAHERARPALPEGLRLAARALLIALLALSLLAGLAGGLARVGLVAPATADAAWLGRALQWHAALMLCGFLGTVIGVERAVAVKRRAAFAAPFLSALGSALLLLGQTAAGAWLYVAASLAFVAVNVSIVRRQRAPHTLLLLVGALAWLAANLLYAFDAAAAATLPGWFAFVVITIAAERLEMARLLRHKPAVAHALHAVLGALLAGAALSAARPVAGGVLYGAALVLLALWLAAFDIARRTVRADGLTRYMALCLLSGYLWLAAAGVAWAAQALGAPLRDVALHALGLGFIVSMVMGHAPVILPAVARVKLLFGAWFYAPLALLHASLLLRLGGGLLDAHWRSAGSLLNVLALALFAVTVAASALAWRVRTGARLRSFHS
jgi:hypothetical protein